MKNFTNEELSTITNALQRALDYVHQQETLTEQVSDLLDLLVPGDGHRLFTLGEWHHSPDLASEIIEWLASTLYGEEESRPRQSKVLSDEGSMVWVRAEHMLDDHWWVEVNDIRFHDTEAGFDEHRERSPGKKPSAAIARIVGSATQDR